MSIWLKRRIVIWCALALLLGGGWWFSSARAQSNWAVSPAPPPEAAPEATPASTPEAAAANFMSLLTGMTDGGMTNLTSIEITGRLLIQSISRLQREKISRQDPGSGEDAIGNLLMEMIGVQHSQKYKGKVVERNSGKAVVELQKVESPALPPVVCVSEDGGWRVDIFSTYAKWKGLSDIDRELLAAKLTGEVSPLLASNPEVMATMHRARENARRATCQSNLKQISLGMMQYMQDYDEKLPPAREWADALQPYLKSEQIFHCPSVTDKNGYGYAYNARLSEKNYSTIPETAQMVSIYETTDLRWNAYGLGEKPAFRHFDGANYAFADGHVKWYEKSRIPQFTFRP